MTDIEPLLEDLDEEEQPRRFSRSRLQRKRSSTMSSQSERRNSSINGVVSSLSSSQEMTLNFDNKDKAYDSK